MMIEKDSNVHVMEVKDVLDTIKEIVVELGEYEEKELRAYIESNEGCEEVLLFCDAYPLSKFIIDKMNIVFAPKKELSLNGGWWYNITGCYINEDIFYFEEDSYTVLKITDGVVSNYFIFVPSII